MRFLIVFFLLFTVSQLFGVSFETMGKDGWVARVCFDGTTNIKTPVGVIITDNKYITNTEVFAAIGEIREFPLGLQDGNYHVTILDGDKKVLMKKNFELKTPFQVALNQTGPDSAEFRLTDFGKCPVRWVLSELDKKNDARSATANGSDEVIRVNELSPGTVYRMEFSAGTYSRSLVFRTGLRNVALNRPVVGTFTRQPVSRFIDDSSPAIVRVNDGRKEWMGGMAVSGEVDSGDQYIYIELSKKTSVRKFRVYWHAFYYPAAYYLLYGLDGRTWKSIKRNAVNFRDEKAGDNSPVKLDEFEITGTDNSAVYAGLVVKKGEKLLNRDVTRNYVELMEFEIYE